MTSSNTPTRTPSNTPTITRTPSLTPTITPTFTPSNTPTLTNTPTPTRTPLFVKVNVYFTDNEKLINGDLPYEVPVTRFVPSSRIIVGAVLDEFFKGPSDVERNQNLALILNGFTGYSKLEFADGVAHVYLEGTCQSNGTLYSIARPLTLNLKQFPDIQFVKIYDQYGDTREPAARVNSIPVCLDPSFTPSATPSLTPTNTLTFTPTFTATSTPTSTSTSTMTPSQNSDQNCYAHPDTEPHPNFDSVQYGNLHTDIYCDCNIYTFTYDDFVEHANTDAVVNTHVDIYSNAHTQQHANKNIHTDAELLH